MGFFKKSRSRSSLSSSSSNSSKSHEKSRLPTKSSTSVIRSLDLSTITPIAYSEKDAVFSPGVREKIAGYAKMDSIDYSAASRTEGTRELQRCSIVRGVQQTAIGQDVVNCKINNQVSVKSKTESKAQSA